jgi:hypothetical protein
MRCMSDGHGRLRLSPVSDAPIYLSEQMVVLARRPIASSAVGLPQREIRMTVTPAVARTRWFSGIQDQLRTLFGLEVGWDTYRARRVDPRLAEEAIAFLAQSVHADTIPSWVVPLSDGGLQLEWHQAGIDLEVAFPADDEAEFFVRDLDTGYAVGGDLSAVASDDLAAYFEKLRLPV